MPENHLFLEWEGIGGQVSINYERLIIGKNDFDFGIRIGLGTINVFDFTGRFNPDVLIPAGITAIYGKRHKIESGWGVTASSSPRYLYENEPLRHLGFYQHIRIGYRYQRPQGGVCFRLVYNPIFVFGSRFYHRYGISIGYVF